MQFGGEVVEAAPSAAVGSGDPARRFACVATGLAARGAEREAWLPLLRARDPVTRAWAVFVLSRTGPFDPLPLLSDSDPEVRYRAAEALGRMAPHPDAAAGVLLHERLADPEALVRVIAAWALLRRGDPDPETLQALVGSLGRETHPAVAREAARRLANLHGPPPEPYDPNLGYARQDASRDAWLAALAARLPSDRVPSVPDPGPTPSEAFLLEDTLEALGEGEPPADIRPLWTRAITGSSRHPRLMEARALLLERLVRRRWSEGLLHADTALALRQAGRLEDARRHYALAIRIHPDVPGLLNAYGSLLEGLGALDEAEGLYRQAAQGAPEDALPILNLGRLLGGRGHRAVAARALIRGESLDTTRWGYHRVGLGALLDGDLAP